MKKIVLSMMIGIGMIVAGSSAIGAGTNTTPVKKTEVVKTAEVIFAEDCRRLNTLPVNEAAALILTNAVRMGKMAGINMAISWNTKMMPVGALDALFEMPDVVFSNIELNTQNYPAYISQKTKKIVRQSDLTIQDNINWLLMGGVNKSTSGTQVTKQRIIVQAVSYAKLSLRSKGKSFVSQITTNSSGVKVVINPVDQEMKPVVDALNAPKLVGLEAALTAIGVDVNGIVRNEAIWNSIESEKDAIFYGTKDPHPSLDGGTILLLGPEGYNAWVKIYNEGQ
jgi:hypothetical protein